MASEAILKELFETSKASVSFKGMKEDDIWNACLKYKDKSDEIIRSAINILHNRDDEAAEKVEMEKKKLEEGHEKMVKLHEQEVADREKDAKDAEKMLDELFE